MHAFALFVFLVTAFLSFHLHQGIHVSSGHGLQIGLPSDVAESETNMKVAVLISGQTYRFVYKDGYQHVPLKGVVCGQSTSSTCSFDVFIVLAGTDNDPFEHRNATEWAMINGSEELSSDRALTEAALDASCLDPPPYERSEKAIRSFFADQGADHVDINILSEEDFAQRVNERDELVQKMGPDALHMTREDWLAIASKQYQWWRYKPNGNMMFLRHLVHASALAAESKLKVRYSHFLYLREDNAFVEPARPIWDTIQHMPSKTVMVDKYCPCGLASVSDKLFLAGRSGAHVLFSATLEEHAMNISSWVNRAIHGNRLQSAWTSYLLGSLMQSENWARHLLTSSGIRLQYGDFHRVDLRYLHNTEPPCTPIRYAGCTKHPLKVYPRCQRCNF